MKIGKKKTIIIAVGVVLILFLVALIIISLNKDDGNVYYRTYTKENEWSRWSKNSSTSGNMKDNITNIEFKTSNKKKDNLIDYNIYSSDTWNSKGIKNDKKPIQGIKISLLYTYSNKYDICYRTYNEKDKWLEWTCDGEISGNKNSNIKAIEVKIIPKNVVKKDYLKDFENTNNSTSVGF